MEYFSNRTTNNNSKSIKKQITNYLSFNIMTDNSNKFVSLQEKNAQVLNNISSLQEQEKTLYNSLNDASLSSEQKQSIIQKINEITQMRMNLYTSMYDMYSYYTKNVEASRTTLGQQINAIDVLENELNQSKIRLNLLDDEKHNNLRLVEINTYYGNRYNTYSKLMKTIALLCIPIIIVSVLASKGILPPRVAELLVGILFLIGLFLVGYQIIDISNRDNMNWDEYNWHFDKSKAPLDKTIGAYANPWQTNIGTCIGSECCYAGSTYDQEKNVCVPNA